jgi:hypothetical protein
MTYEEPYPEVQAAYFYQVVAAPIILRLISELPYTGSPTMIWSPPLQLAIYPNPCVAGRDALTIKTNANAGSVLTIFNLRGQLVRELPVSTIGESQSTWDLRDSRGKLCGSGIYYLRLDSPGAPPMQKRVLILQ